MSKIDFVNSLNNKKKSDVSNNLQTFIDISQRVNVPVKNSLLDIFCGDVIDYIPLIKEDIHLVATSPPYNCNIKYDSYNDNKDIVEYQNWLTDIFKLINNKMVDGGRVAINFPLLIKNNDNRILLINIFTQILIDSGFQIIDCINWVKAKSEQEAVGVAGRSTAWGSWLSPSSPNIRPINEFILIAKKQGKYSSKGKSDITKEEFKLYTMSTWFIPSKSSKDHPASFPVELPKRLIKLLTYKNENILDPFLGIGSSAIAAIETERNFYGCDISKLYIAKTLERIGIADVVYC